MVMGVRGSCSEGGDSPRWKSWWSSLLRRSALDLVERIRAVNPARVEVIFEPDLLPKMRFLSDHVGTPAVHTPEQHRRWREHLARPTSFGIFQPMIRTDLADWPMRPKSNGSKVPVPVSDRRSRRGDCRYFRIICTTARGVHGGQSAEFVFLALLMHAKNIRHLETEQHAHRWTDYCTDELADKTLAVVGAGHMGSRVAALGKAFRMHVIATARHHSAERAAALGIDAFYPMSELNAMVAMADAW